MTRQFSMWHNNYLKSSLIMRATIAQPARDRYICKQNGEMKVSECLSTAKIFYNAIHQ